MLLFFSFTVIRTSRPRLAAKVTPSPQPGHGAYKETLWDPVAKIGAGQVAGNSNLKFGVRPRRHSQGGCNLTSIWVKFRFKKGNSHFNMGQVPLQHRASMSRCFVLSCVPFGATWSATVRVSFLSSSRARGRQDRTARLGRAPGSEALDRQDRTTRCCLARTAGRPRASG